MGVINLTENELLNRIKHLPGLEGQIILEDSLEEKYNNEQMLQIDDSKFKARLGYKGVMSIDEVIIKTFLANKTKTAK